MVPETFFHRALALILAGAAACFTSSRAQGAGPTAGIPSVSHPAPAFRGAPFIPAARNYLPFPSNYSRLGSGHHFRNRVYHPFLGYDPFYTPNLLIPKTSFTPTFGRVTGGYLYWLPEMYLPECSPGDLYWLPELFLPDCLRSENASEADLRVEKSPQAVVKPRARSAHIKVKLPRRAKLWFNGKKTASRGRQRQFQTPLLEPGREYVYEIRARWQKKGRPITQSQKVRVTAGARIHVDFPEKSET